MTQKRLGTLAVLLLAVAGCASAATPQPVAGDKLSVVATFSILGDWVQNVGGDRVDVRTLVGPGGDAHEFDPTPAAASAIAEAVLVFENGLAFEAWLDDLYASSGSSARRIVVTEGIAPLEGMEGEHGEFDPHVWHDVHNAIRMVENIRDGLIAADPDGEYVYRANAGAYIAQLRALDGWLMEQVQALPEDRRKLVTSHDTFNYFAARYGFEVIGSALGSISTESADPAAGEIAGLVEDIKAAGVPAIFAENVSNRQLMEQIANEAGVTLAPALYTDALGEPGGEGDTYVKMIRYNVTTIVDALSR